VTPTIVLLKNPVFWDVMLCCWAAVPGISQNHISFNIKVMQTNKCSCVSIGCVVGGVGNWHTGCWFGGINCDRYAQFLRDALYCSKLLEYLQNNRLVSSEDFNLDLCISYICATLFNAFGQKV
jgi:hypothetical protein